jgi:transcriptional regulator with GAF, ATPase, and Fis domain
MGGTKEIAFDVRIMAASSVSLEEAMRRGHFRADHYHRIDASRIEGPPLRERAEDIPLLTKAFLAQFGRAINRGEIQACRLGSET